MTNNKLRIAAYIRSACGNKEDIIRQETIIMMYCKKYFSNYTIDFYTDTKCSGITLNKRKAYPILRDKLCNNEYDILIVDKNCCLGQPLFFPQREFFKKYSRGEIP